VVFKNFKSDDDDKFWISSPNWTREPKFIIMIWSKKNRKRNKNMIFKFFFTKLFLI